MFLITANFVFTLDFEKKAIRAAAEIQAQIGCGVSFHPHRNPAAPAEIIRLHLEAGGRADKTVMSHLDRKKYFKNVIFTNKQTLFYNTSSMKEKAGYGRLCFILNFEMILVL